MRNQCLADLEAAGAFEVLSSLIRVKTFLIDVACALILFKSSSYRAQILEGF
jgi:hypothetical protein